MRKNAALPIFTVTLVVLVLSQCASPLRRYTYVAELVTGAAVTTYGGITTKTGVVDGFSQGPQALLGNPLGTAVDSNGNIYVADSATNSIRKISPTGDVTTVAGSVSAGEQDGIGTAAEFSSPQGLAADSLGNLYVTDYPGGTVRKISLSTRQVTTICSGLSYPYGLAVNAAGDAVYVSDIFDSVVYKLTSSDNFTTSAGTLSMAMNIDIISPMGLALDKSGNLWVIDGNNTTVRKIVGADNAGVGTFPLISTALTFTGTGFTAFNTPHFVAVDGSGVLYVSDFSNSTIYKLKMASAGATSGTVTLLAGLPGSPDVTDGLGTVAQFNGPEGLAFDSSTGSLYVADSVNHTVRVLTSGAGGFAGSAAAAANTTVATYAGSTDNTGAPTDGKRRVALFNQAEGVAVDASGTVYVADTNNHLIRKISTAGVVSTIAGSGIGTFANGVGTAASFNHPKSVAVDSTGTLYVADATNNTVRMISPSGVVTTPSFDFSGSGLAGFGSLHGIAIDTEGHVYVGDFGNGVLKLTWNSGHTAMTVHVLYSTPTARCVSVGPDGSVYVATDSGVVYKISQTGSATPVMDSTGTPVFLNSFAVAVDQKGNVFGCTSNIIYMVTPSGVVSVLAGQTTAADVDGNGTSAMFAGPSCFAVDSSGNLYVSDYGGSTIRKVTIARKSAL